MRDEIQQVKLTAITSYERVRKPSSATELMLALDNVENSQNAADEYIFYRGRWYLSESERRFINGTN